MVRDLEPEQIKQNLFCRSPSTTAPAVYSFVSELTKNTNWMGCVETVISVIGSDHVLGPELTSCYSCGLKGCS